MTKVKLNLLSDVNMLLEKDRKRYRGKNMSLYL